MRTTLIAAFCLAPFLCAQGPVSGRVVNASTGEPLAEVVVSLTQESTIPQAQQPVFTDAKGHFFFASLPPGIKRKLQFSRYEFVDATYPPPFRYLEVGTSGLTGIEVQLTPGAVLSGTAFDAQGKPYYQLSAVRHKSIDGEAVRETRHLSNRKNPTGQFRLYGLRAGEYTLYAEGQELAGAYILQTGEHRELPPLTIPPPTRLAISGRLSTPPHAAAPKTVFALGPTEASAPIDAQGNFSLSALKPGQYTLVATAQTFDPSDCEVLTVTLGNQDLSNVRLLPPARFDLHGSIQYDAVLGSLRVGVKTTCGYHFAYTASDGSFLVPALAHQPYRLSVQLPPDYFIRELLQDGKPVATSDLAPGPVEVIIDSRHATLSGSASALDYTAMVYLLPIGPQYEKDPRAGHVHLKFGEISPQTNAFHFPKLIPGDYHLFAIEGPLNVLLIDSVLDVLGAKSLRITLAPGENRHITVPVLTGADFAAAGIELSH